MTSIRGVHMPLDNSIWSTRVTQTLEGATAQEEIICSNEGTSKFRTGRDPNKWWTNRARLFALLLGPTRCVSVRVALIVPSVAEHQKKKGQEDTSWLEASAMNGNWVKTKNCKPSEHPESKSRQLEQLLRTVLGPPPTACKTIWDSSATTIASQSI